MKPQGIEDKMQNDHWLIIISYDGCEKVIKRKTRSFIDPIGYATGYLQALSDKGIEIKNVDVEVFLESNDGKYSEIMPSGSIKKAVMS